MRIEELIDIVQLADKKDIEKQFKRLGYIYCYGHRQLEKIGIASLVNATIQSTEDFSDKRGKTIYSGHICGTVENYEDYEFVFVTVSGAKEYKDPLDHDESVLQTEILVWAIEKDED